MKESFWAAYIVVLGIVAIIFIFLFQSLTNTDEHNMSILKETTEAAMYDAFDYAGYRRNGTIKIDREQFVENFLRRSSETASLARSYKIEIYDVKEIPPKESIKVVSYETAKLFSGGGISKEETLDIIVSNRIDAILE